MSARPWKRRVKTHIFGLLSWLLTRARRRFSLPEVMRRLSPSLLGEDTVEKAGHALCLLEQGRGGLEDLLQLEYDWQQLVQPITSGERVLLVGQDKGSRLLVQILRERGCQTERVELHHLPEGLGEDEHYQRFADGIDWQEECFPTAAEYDWALVGPEIAFLYHRPALLDWLRRRYRVERFLLRLPQMSDESAAALALNAPLSRRYRVLYSAASAELEWSCDYRIVQLSSQTPLTELHCQLLWQPTTLAVSEQPLVSVIIPVYNVEPYLRRCLDSVVRQSLKQIEIIAINDASLDRCGDIIAEYQRREPRLRSLTNPVNVRQGETRNRGMAVANGDYLFFLDSDDYLHPECLRTLYLLALRSGSDAVLQVNSRYPVPTAELNCYLRYRGGGELILPFESPYFTSSIFNLYHRRLLQDHQMKFLPGYYEDLLFSTQLTSVDATLLLAPVGLLHYYQRPDSLSNKAISPKEISDSAEVMRYLKGWLHQQGWLQRQENTYRYLLMLRRYWQIWLAPRMLAAAKRTRHFELLRLFWAENHPLFEVPAEGILRHLRQQLGCPPSRSRDFWPFLLRVRQTLDHLAADELARATPTVRDWCRQRFCAWTVYRGPKRD